MGRSLSSFAVVMMRAGALSLAALGCGVQSSGALDFGKDKPTPTPEPVSECPEGAVYCDDFTDGVDPSAWESWTIGEGASIAGADGAIVVNLAPDARQSGEPSDPDHFGARLRNACLIQGDFSLRVDFELREWPEANGVRVGLGVGTGAGAVERVSLSAQDIAQGEFYLTHFDEPRGFVETADLTGSMQVERRGNILTGMYLKGGVWIVITTGSAITTDALPFQLGVWSHDGIFSGNAVELTLDNVILQRGTLSCP